MFKTKTSQLLLFTNGRLISKPTTGHIWTTLDIHAARERGTEREGERVFFRRQRNERDVFPAERRSKSLNEGGVFKIYDEAESSHLGAMFKMYDDPKSLHEGGRV